MPLFRPIFPYYGGKVRLVPHLLKILPAHRIYVEVFGGAASLLFAKPKSRIEIYNDIWNELVILFRMLRDRPDDLIRAIKYTPYSSTEFEYVKNREPDALDELEIARRCYVKICASYGAKGSRWGRFMGRAPAFHREFEEFASRIRNVQIENLDFKLILKKYDGYDVLFYCDPPYIRTRAYNPSQYGLSVEEHGELVKILLTLKGKVILSGYRNMIYRILEEKGWIRRDIGVLNTMKGRGSHGKRMESIWMNFDPQNTPLFRANKRIDDYY